MENIESCNVGIIAKSSSIVLELSSRVRIALVSELLSCQKIFSFF